MSLSKLLRVSLSTLEDFPNIYRNQENERTKNLDGGLWRVRIMWGLLGSAPQMPDAQGHQGAARKGQDVGEDDGTEEELVIVVGDELEITGLQSRPELNRKFARVVAHDPMKGAWYAPRTPIARAHAIASPIPYSTATASERQPHTEMPSLDAACGL